MGYSIQAISFKEPLNVLGGTTPIISCVASLVLKLNIDCIKHDASVIVTSLTSPTSLHSTQELVLPKFFFLVSV